MTQVLAAAAMGAWQSRDRHALVHRGLALTGGAAHGGGLARGRGLLLATCPGARSSSTFALMTTIALPLMLVSPAEPPGGEDRAAVTFDRAVA